MLFSWNEVVTKALKVLKRQDLIYLFIFSVLIRFLALYVGVQQTNLETVATVTPDAVNYVDMADAMLNYSDAEEKWIFTFGPGFSFYLALISFLSEGSKFIMLLLNIILSSLSCLLIYKLARLLNFSYSISIFAGWLSALSYTSITLSCILLSDTFYFFLFVLSLVMFLRGLQKNSWIWFVSSGFGFGYAILTRAIGQFWPFVIIILAIIHYRLYPDIGRFKKKMLLGSVVTFLICLIFISAWSIRNYYKHDIATLTSASSGGPRNLAVYTCERLGQGTYKQITRNWYLNYLETNDLEYLDAKQYREYDLLMFKKTFSKYPLDLIKAYLFLTWENINSVNQIPRSLFPRWKSITIRFEYFLINNYLNYLSFFLSILGIFYLILQKQYLSGSVLGSIYFYYALLIGFTRWQGSRLFYPSQIAENILIAIVVIAACKSIWHLFRVLIKKSNF